jgi:hypothetical protein
MNAITRGDVTPHHNQSYYCMQLSPSQAIIIVSEFFYMEHECPSLMLFNIILLCHAPASGPFPPGFKTELQYSGRKITESLGNVAVRGEKWKEQGGSAMADSLSEHV